MITHISHRIQNAIQMEIFGATKSIKIAVSWFTNELLFQPLLLKLQAGVNIEIILNDDEINRSKDSLNFDDFLRLGGILRWNTSKQLMHDKFCIIDDRVVICGSYNWTNKAEYNDENVIIFKDEIDTIRFFIDKYSELSKKYIAINKIDEHHIKTELPILDYSCTTTKYYDYEHHPGLLEAANVKDDDWKYRKIINGIQYSQDGKRLLKCNLQNSYVEVNPNVIVICDSAFENCSNLEYINIPNSVKCIGKRAFACCKKLKSINLPVSTLVLGEAAFMSCYELAAVAMPNVLLIGEKCFAYTKALKELILPASLKFINGNPVVNSCVTNIISNSPSFTYENGILYGKNYTMLIACLENKSQVQIHNNVIYIGKYAFNRCRQLVTIHFSKNTTKIGECAFCECSNLKDVYMGDFVRVIEAEAFKCCSSLDYITFSKSLKIISNAAFGCSGLKSIVLPNSLIEIGGYAFYACKNLETIKLSNNLQKMGKGVFDGSHKIKEIILPNSITSDLGRTFERSEIEKIIVPKGSRPKLIVSAKRYHHSGVSGTTVALEAVPSQRTKRYHRSA